MFRTLIDKPIDPIPLQYIDKLRRPNGEFDYSLTCLGISMLRPRIEDYEGIDGKFETLIDDESSCVDDFIHDNNYSEPSFSYYVFKNDCDIATIKEKLSKDGYEIKESIGALLKTKANANCTAVYHKTKNHAAVFINSTDIRFYHIVISFISLLFPSLFKDNPLNEEDYNIIKSLSKTDANAFIRSIQAATQKYLPEFRRIMLGDLLKGMHKAKIDAAKRHVDEQRNYIKSIEENYEQAIISLKKMIATFEGMKITESFGKPEEELIEYLADKKEIHNLKIENNILSFTVATLLNNYNENAWSTFKDRGYIYDGNYTDGGKHNIELLDVFKKKENRKLLLDNIFSENPEFVIKIAGNYKINFDADVVRTERNYNYTAADPIFQSYLPNPHLKIFSCLGGYERRMNRAVRDRNYIGVIELCCASAGSVDLDETEQTFRPFIGWLMMSREKVLKRRDGVEMTPEEALLYLIDKEKANETNKDE